MTVLAPASAAEMRAMFEWALQLDAPVAIRYPKNTCAAECPAFSLPMETGRGVFTVTAAHSNLLLVCTGGIYPETAEAAALLRQKGISADIYNLRFLKPIDEAFFLEKAKKYPAVLFIEDGAYIGGVGHYLESLVQKQLSGIKTAVRAFPDTVFMQGSRQDVLECAGLTGEQLAKAASALCR